MASSEGEKELQTNVIPRVKLKAGFHEVLSSMGRRAHQSARTSAKSAKSASHPSSSVGGGVQVSTVRCAALAGCVAERGRTEINAQYGSKFRASARAAQGLTPMSEQAKDPRAHLIAQSTLVTVHQDRKLCAVQLFLSILKISICALSSGSRHRRRLPYTRRKRLFCNTRM